MARLVLAAVLENIGYRQLAMLRAKAWWTVLHPTRGWGEMTRTGHGDSHIAPAPALLLGATLESPLPPDSGTEPEPLAV